MDGGPARTQGVRVSSSPGTTARTAAAIRDYAALCRDELPDDHHVRSYAGVWLLLATLAPVVTDPAARAGLEAALGLEVDEAAARARTLLADRRKGLAAAVAGWLRDDVTLTGALPVDLDPLPDQDGLDRWARAATDGLVERFPVPVEPTTVLVLASALVARTRWQEPLDSTGDDRMLVREDGLLAVVETQAAGLVAVASPAGEGGLDVVSVVADPGLPQTKVWDAVDEVCGWIVDQTLLGRRVPAARLDRDGHAWSVVRKTWSAPDGSSPREVWRAEVPAWSLDTTTELDGAPGVAAVSDAVLALVPLQPQDSRTVQAATATYGAKGFEAAAVTVMAFMAGAASPPAEKARVVTLRFDRPHAVVALARGGAWEGVPVVHAWVDGRSDKRFTADWGI